MNNHIEVVDLGTKKEIKTYHKKMNVYVVLENMFIDKEILKKYKPLYMKSQYLEFDNPYHDHTIINYSEIDKVVLNISKKLNVWGMFLENKYLLDMNVYQGDKVYKFEIQNKEISQIIDFLKKLSIEIVDMNDSLKKYLNWRK